MTYIIYVYIFFFTLYLSIFLVLPDRWWVRGLQLHVSEASASAAPSDWSLCVRKQPEPGRSNMEARQVTPRGVSQLCRGERRISGSTEAKIFYPRLKQNFPQDRKNESWKWNVDTSQFSPMWRIWLLVESQYLLLLHTERKVICWTGCLWLHQPKAELYKQKWGWLISAYSFNKGTTL